MDFPFDVPADLTALSADDFAAFQTQVREHAAAIAEDQGASAADLIATRDLHVAVTAEHDRRAEEAAEAATARAELAAGLAPATPPAATAPATAPTEPRPFPDEPPVTPAAPAAEPIVASTATPAPRSTIDQPSTGTAERYGVLVASVDAPSPTGELADFSAVGELLDKQFGRYGRPKQGAVGRAPLAPGGSKFAIGGRSMVRHSIAGVRREYPSEYRITDVNHAREVLDRVRNEANLPGGSLVASHQQRMDTPLANGRARALTAAAGWCAPSEVLYDLCSLASLDGILDIPTIQASRGGFQIPEDGGPNFSVIFDAIGDEGDVILSEYDVQNGVDKVCTEIPCPPFEDVRLDVAYLCLTGALLQQRGYPEAVTQFSQQAIIALAHKVNESVIARMVAGSTAPVTFAADASGDDAASATLSAVELAIWDMRYRNRMPMGSTVEVVFPAWVVGPIRAGLARRRGVEMLAVSDAEITSWFAMRGARVQFVYDWQDAFSGGAFGGSASAIVYPATVNMLVYPAGTWVKGEQDVIQLDTVYDNALLTQNQFTALFVEDGFSVMKMCHDSRNYVVPVDPSGVTGCCP